MQQIKEEKEKAAVRGKLEKSGVLKLDDDNSERVIQIGPVVS